MKSWDLSGAGEWWLVKLDVREPGGHVGTSYHDWAGTLTSRVVVVAEDVWTVLPTSW